MPFGPGRKKSRIWAEVLDEIVIGQTLQEKCQQKRQAEDLESSKNRKILQNYKIIAKINH